MNRFDKTSSRPKITPGYTSLFRRRMIMMSIKENLKLVTEELQSIFDQLEEEQLDQLIFRIHTADRVFLAGAGRARLAVCGFAMRLMQAGLTVFVAGETVTPSITEKDLLIIASGSGYTETLQVIARKGKQAGACLALFTIAPDSPIARLADCLIEIPAATSKLEAAGHTSVQPGASSFEQSVLLIGDVIAASILPGETTAAKNRTLMKYHANLE